MVIIHKFQQLYGIIICYNFKFMYLILICKKLQTNLITNKKFEILIVYFNDIILLNILLCTFSIYIGNTTKKFSEKRIKFK